MPQSRERGDVYFVSLFNGFQKSRLRIQSTQRHVTTTYNRHDYNEGCCGSNEFDIPMSMPVFARGIKLAIQIVRSTQKVLECFCKATVNSEGLLCIGTEPVALTLRLYPFAWLSS